MVNGILVVEGYIKGKINGVGLLDVLIGMTRGLKQGLGMWVFSALIHKL